MSEPQNDQTLASPTPGDDDGIRLELKPGFRRTGFVDGGWWPRSRDLRAELPDLVAALTARLGDRAGHILRVGFGRKEWDPIGRQRLVTPTGRVAFGGWDVFEPDLFWVVSHSTALMPIALVVVPPETPRDRAESVLRRAGSVDNTERPAELLGHQDGSVDQPAEPVGTTPATTDALQRA